MTLRQMEYFVVVIEEGSFSKAASRLNVTQPALSQQVKALESDLGVALLERLGRGVRVTAAGRAYLPHAHATISAHRRGRWAVHSVASGQAGELELAAVISVGQGVLVRPLIRWHREWPNVAVRLSEFWHRRALEEFVAGGGADLAIGPQPPSWEGPSVPLGKERFVLILPPNDPAAREIMRYRETPPRAAQMSIGTLPLPVLEDRQWVLFDRSNGLSEVVEAHLATAGLRTPSASLRTTQFMTAAMLASSGMGPTLIPANVVPADLAGLVCEPDPPLLRPISAYSRNAIEGFAARFVELIHAESTMLE